jgi:hypothetical protein
MELGSFRGGNHLYTVVVFNDILLLLVSDSFDPLIPCLCELTNVYNQEIGYRVPEPKIKKKLQY